MLLSNIPQSLVIHTRKKWNESWESLVNMIIVPKGPKTARVLRVSSKHACVDKLTSLRLDSPRPIGGKKCVIIGLNGWWPEFAPFNKLALKLLLPFWFSWGCKMVYRQGDQSGLVNLYEQLLSINTTSAATLRPRDRRSVNFVIDDYTWCVFYTR